MHKSVYQHEPKMISSYFRRQNHISPIKSATVLNASCLKSTISQNKTQRLQTQSIYQIESCIQQKKTLKQRINERISKEMSAMSHREKHTIPKKVENQSKVKQATIQQSQKRLSCIRKMLFEYQSPLQQRVQNKQNECQNKTQLKTQRLKLRKEFDYRQKKQIQTRLQRSALKRQKQDKMELEGCTFKPKLTKYNPYM